MKAARQPRIGVAHVLAGCAAVLAVGSTAVAWVSAGVARGRVTEVEELRSKCGPCCAESHKPGAGDRPGSPRTEPSSSSATRGSTP